MDGVWEVRIDSCASKTCQRGLQNLLILLESRVAFDSNPDDLCLQTCLKTFLQ